MSDASRSLGASAEPNRVGPDYFSFYKREVAELFSQDDDFLPSSSQICDFTGKTHVVKDKDITKNNYSAKEGNCFTGSLFCDVLGAGILDYKKERAKALLRQSVVAFTQEVDEMLDPVVAMRRIQSYLVCKKSLCSYSGAASSNDVGQHPYKKLKSSSSSSSISVDLQSSPVSCRVSGEV
ncbi:unnamed protein product [Ilex paraguariensis]|uniref:Uncharacterized protein n=1 Tax=Ilex paraguariensis TaxID=185542 RepID=A0ABC8UHD6_9AQUA